jgi:hypothetical protein
MIIIPYFSSEIRFRGKLNSITFPHCLTSRPGFATATSKSSLTHDVFNWGKVQTAAVDLWCVIVCLWIEAGKPDVNLVQLALGKQYRVLFLTRIVTSLFSCSDAVDRLTHYAIEYQTYIHANGTKILRYIQCTPRITATRILSCTTTLTTFRKDSRVSHSNRTLHHCFSQFCIKYRVIQANMSSVDNISSSCSCVCDL